MSARQMIAYLRPAGGFALLGLLGWTSADALNELLVYKHCQRYRQPDHSSCSHRRWVLVALLCPFSADVWHRLALEKATENAELSEQLGLPLNPGPWYNASIGLTHRDKMANCQFTLVGSKHSSDIYMRVGDPFCPLLLINPFEQLLAFHTCLRNLQVVRTKGPRSTLLYNLVGSANWEVLIMEASISAGGGLSRNISLTDIPKTQEAHSVS